MNILGKAGAGHVRPLRRRAPIYPARLLDDDLMTVLAQSAVPLSAYDIAARLQEKGRHTVVVSVYRSLDRLNERGLVEKVETTSRFRIRDVPNAMLVTCSECGLTVALAASCHHAALEAVIAAAGFAGSRIVLEAVGVCRDCRAGEGR